MDACADPRRTESMLDRLAATGAAPALKRPSAEQARILTALLSGSQVLGELLLAQPDLLAPLLDVEALRFARQEQGLRREVDEILRPSLTSGDFATGFASLRGFKQREMLRIAARDLARLATLPEILREISDVADACLDAVFRLCMAQLTGRFGRPYHLDARERWRPTPFCVLGLGKLGGQELNYSSDVDVLFVYEEEGSVFRERPRAGEQAGKGLTNHQFFTRLAEAFVEEVRRLAPEGMLYRIDLRLRPEGRSGPLARSVESYENFYAQWGQTWERMMLIKARCVAGDAPLAGEFLEMVQPFRYARSLGPRILGEVAAMKQRIENEVVKAGELERNVKLGRGGIREIEFIAQTLQLLHAGRIPFLQGARTLPTLQGLVRYKLLTAEHAQELTEAYCFLRDVEHRLQMENNLQTHTIPTERRARERLAALMGCGSLAEFEAARLRHTGNVRRIYAALLDAEAPSRTRELPADFDDAEGEWKSLLHAHSFRDPDKAVRLLREFVHGPGYVHVSARTVELAMELVPRFLTMCPGGGSKVQSQKFEVPATTLSDPDRVLARLDSYITAYGARAVLYEAWTMNPSLFGLLLQLFDRSEFLAETAVRTPDLVDELEQSGRLRRSKSSAEILAELRLGRADADQRLWLRRYHQAEFMRIGLRDILGLADAGQHMAELSALADACLQHAVEVVVRANKLRAAPFVVIGLGKLGGAEITYGSDLDVQFVADDKAKSLPQLQPLAAEVMDLLSVQTEQGAVFKTDARLRPDGEKGLLVNTIEAYEEYYRQRAMLWEIQALTRARAVAGDLEVGRRFQTVVAVLTDFRLENVSRGFVSQREDAAAERGEGRPGLAAWTPEWKQEIAQMRLRIEKERTPAGKGPLAIKTGAGGLVDAEFISQSLCLANGWQEANTLSALRHARERGALEKTGADSLIENYQKLRRIECILRRWSFEGETELPDEPEPLQRVAVRCGFTNAAEFMQAVGGYRSAIRAAYAKWFAEEQRGPGL